MTVNSCRDGRHVVSLLVEAGRSHFFDKSRPRFSQKFAGPRIARNLRMDLFHPVG